MNSDFNLGFHLTIRLRLVIHSLPYCTHCYQTVGHVCAWQCTADWLIFPSPIITVQRQMYRTTSSQHYVSSAMISKTRRICGDRILHKILSFAHDISSSKGTVKFPKRIVKLKDEMRDDFEHAHYFFIAFSFLEEFFRLNPLINVLSWALRFSHFPKGLNMNLDLQPLTLQLVFSRAYNNLN